MLTKTTETAFQVLIYLGLRESEQRLSPAQIAQQIGASRTYLSKIAGQLVKADILRAYRGVRGGVTLAREPGQIQLLEVVEACQGRVLGDYCEGQAEPSQVCAYHRIMWEMHDAILTTLKRYTLADLLAQPGPAAEIVDRVDCRVACACDGKERAE